MTDVRRALLWVVLSMSLIFLWDSWRVHQGQDPLFGVAPTTSTSSMTGASAGPASAANNAGIPTAVPTTTATTTPAAPKDAATPASETFTVSTDMIQATLDSKGGDLVKLELLKHRDSNDSTKNVVIFDRSQERLYLAQTGLISSQAGLELPNHLTILKRVTQETQLQQGQDQLQVRWESPGDKGVKLVKTLTFHRGSYVVNAAHEIINTSGAAISPQIYYQLVRDGNPPKGESKLYFTFTGPAIYTEDKKFTKINFGDIEDTAENARENNRTTNNGWTAMVQHYFASAWLLGNERGFVQDRTFFTKKVATNKYAVGMITPVGVIQPGEKKTMEARLFAGPQEEHKLAQIEPGLELVKDYGWFTILAKPLFWLLTQLYGLLGNWGWAIVALVVLLKIAFYWLNASAYRSMAKMKAVQPRVMALRERQKDNPQQMQQEMMKIYREEKVNPVGGCLPMVAQMPFFIALYWVLLSTVEMRNAPWIGWINDLSAIDPYYILPLLMTATSLLQTWLNPTPADPMQAKMMWLMPLVFSIMFFFFPAGLVLYWLTNNILSIAQQYMINKRLGVT